MEQKFFIKFAFSGQHWNWLSTEKCNKSQFLGCLIKIYISVLNFSTESAKKLTVCNLLFLITLYSPKNGNRHPSDEKVAPQQLLCCNQSFSWFGTHFYDRPKVLTYSQIPLGIFLLTDCPMKIRVSQAQSNWFVFKEGPDYKRGVRRFAHTHNE